MIIDRVNINKIASNIGEDFFFGNMVEINQFHNSKFGNHSAIDSFFFASVPLDIGDYVHIAPHVSVIGGKDSKFTLDHFTFVAAGSRIICGSEDYTSGGLMGATIPKKYKAPTKISPVVFERFAGIGTNCIVMPGVTLAEGSMVGAGAVVTKSTEPWGIYLGSPAKLIKFKSKENIEKTLEYAKEMGY